MNSRGLLLEEHIIEDSSESCSSSKAAKIELIESAR